MPKAPASRQWTTCLKIPSDSTSDTAPALDPGWCQAKGINPCAPRVARLLKDKVVTLIRALRSIRGFEAFHFLVHDRESGVPTTPDDHAAYIHLRLFFMKPTSLPVERLEAEGFVFTQPIEVEQKTMAGVDLGRISGGLDTATQLLNAQSAWVLDFIAAHEWTDDAEIVRQTRQYLHYFANMLQVSAS